MAKLTEQQRYELGMSMYKAEQSLARQLENAKVGETIQMDMTIKIKVEEIEVNRITNEYKFKEA